MNKYSHLIEIIKVVAIVFTSAIIVRYLVFQPFVVEGSSMEPTFTQGEYLLIDKLSYRLYEPNRGDVIVFRYPSNQKLFYIKRVIGLPGETVTISSGAVYIGGKLLREPYLGPNVTTLVNRSTQSSYEARLKEDEFFVMGDNRSMSSDSRDWGPLQRRFIIGRSSLVVFPTQSVRAVTAPSY